jgi:hypothetical protein
VQVGYLSLTAEQARDTASMVFQKHAHSASARTLANTSTGTILPSFAS